MQPTRRRPNPLRNVQRRDAGYGVFDIIILVVLLLFLAFLVKQFL